MGPGPIKSPLQMFPPQPPVRHLHVEHHEHKRKNSFLTQLAILAIMAIGLGAVWAFTAFPPGSTADQVASFGLLAFLYAAALAIVEHSQAAELKEAHKEAAKIISQALKDFKI